MHLIKTRWQRPKQEGLQVSCNLRWNGFYSGKETKGILWKQAHTWRCLMCVFRISSQPKWTCCPEIFSNICRPSGCLLSEPLLHSWAAPCTWIKKKPFPVVAFELCSLCLSSSRVSSTCRHPTYWDREVVVLSLFEVPHFGSLGQASGWMLLIFNFTTAISRCLLNWNLELRWEPPSFLRPVYSHLADPCSLKPTQS